MSTTRPLELLHMDFYGSTTYKSLGGNVYCLVIVDDFSCYTWTIFPEDKTQASSEFKKFAKLTQNQFEAKIKKIQSDNGIELKNLIIDAYCDKKGIKHEFLTAYTLKQNGVVERKKNTSVTLARAMLNEYGTSKRFWAEAINMACYTSNRVYLIDSSRRPRMSCLSRGSLMLATFGFLDTSAISSRRKGLESSKRGLMLVFSLATPDPLRHIGCSTLPQSC
jgi:transposase InsO family protein